VKKAESFIIIPQNEDNIVIEQKRKKLIHSAMTKGLTDSQTHRISEEIDAAILSIMKKQHFSRFPNV
jgi:Spo0E like sporulation regulatory protein